VQVLSVAVYNHYKRIYNNNPNGQGGNHSSRQDIAVMEQGLHQNVTHRGTAFVRIMFEKFH
jgi:ATP-dependent protease Clp ATPase subunit